MSPTRLILATVCLTLPLACQTPAPTLASNNLRPHLNEVTQFSRYAADNETLGLPAAGQRRRDV